MEQDILVSVIVPVYQVEEYLARCVDSILAQTYGNLEVILVDDGSKDTSGQICEEYAAKDPRVQVVHKENGGLSSARNAGIDAARGEYLEFVDSDDYLEPNVYGHMLRVLQTTQADAAQFSFREVYVNRQEEKLLDMGCPEMDSKTYLVRFTKDWSCPLLWNKLYRREDNVFCDGRNVVPGREYLTWYLTQWHCALLWNKVYKRSLFDGIFFEEGHKIDDEYFTYQGFLGARRVVFDTRVVYNYRRRRSSVMASSEAAKQRVLDCMDSIVKRRMKVIGVFPELKAAFDENYLDALCYLSTNPACTPEVIDYLKALLKAYRESGNTFPPRYLWRKLLRLHFLPTKKLMQGLSQDTEIYANTEDCFE